MVWLDGHLGVRDVLGVLGCFFMLLGALGLDTVSFHSWKNSGGGVSQVSVLEHELLTGAEIRGAAAAV